MKLSTKEAMDEIDTNIAEAETRAKKDYKSRNPDDSRYEMAYLAGFWQGMYRNAAYENIVLKECIADLKAQVKMLETGIPEKD